jgi:hypothetical protein
LSESDKNSLEICEREMLRRICYKEKPTNALMIVY